VVFLGNAMVVFKIFAEPDSIDSVDKLLRKVKEGTFRDLKREPIGFGIEVIRAGYIIPDKVDGALETLENAVKKVKGVNQVEVDMMTLI
jgi:translation elongation factor EF-1beta